MIRMSLCAALVLGSNALVAQSPVVPARMRGGLAPSVSGELDVIPGVRTRGAISLPAAHDLSSKMPPVGNQGGQNSCVAWATTYAVLSYYQSRRRGWSFGQSPQSGGAGSHVFSPAWTYNQINGGRDHGTSFPRALTLLRYRGAVPWNQRPYSENDYLFQPTSRMQRAAQSYRIRDFAQVGTTDPRQIKAQLSAGHPVIAGVMVHDEFIKVGSGIVDRQEGDPKYGHAVVVVGYNDGKRSERGHLGAFKLMNSWGTGWGKGGFGWISYQHFAKIATVAFVIQEGEPPKEPRDSPEKIPAPGRVSASQGTHADRIIVSWQGVERAVAYEVQKREKGKGSFARATYTHDTSWIDTSVQTGLAYEYRVTAISNTGRSDPPASPTAEGFAIVRSSPVVTQVIGLSAKAEGTPPIVRLNWQAVDGASAYRVARWKPDSREWAELAVSKSTHQNDYGPDRSSVNHYRVRAEHGADQGPWSAVVQIRASPATGGPPGRVTSLFASEGTYPDQISLGWSPVPSATEYIVQRWDSGQRKWDRSFTTNEIALLDRSTEVRSGRTFIYVVRARSNGGISAQFSPYASGYTRPRARGGSAPPRAPSAFRGVIGADQKTISFNWKKSAGAQAYRVYRRPEGDKRFVLLGEFPASQNTLTQPLEHDSRVHFYSATALDSLGTESAHSVPVAGFRNPGRIAHRTVFRPDEGLSNFLGDWRAHHWTQDNRFVPLKISIAARGNRFQALVRYGSATKTFSGSYAAKSRQIIANGFTFQLLPEFQNDLARIEIRMRSAGKQSLSLNIQRVQGGGP